MKFTWNYELDESLTLKEFLKHLNISRKFLSAIKQGGGTIKVDGQLVYMNCPLQKGQVIEVIAPHERGHDSVPPSFEEIQIVYEDRDYIILNKEAGIVSIPSIREPSSSVANRLRGYYQQQNYNDQVIHIVTRLDRETSGLMLIAKHRLAHHYLDQQIRKGQVERIYYGLSSRNNWPAYERIDLPIARSEESIITRCVHPDGQDALTEVWCEAKYEEGSLLRFKLHTGRTHQIRVHAQALEGVLIADTLYGAQEDPYMKRHALHCGKLSFYQPFEQTQVTLTVDLPPDMKEWINQASKSSDIS